MRGEVRVDDGELRYEFVARSENGRGVVDASFRGPQIGVRFQGLTGNDLRQIRNDLDRAIRQLDELNSRGR